MDLYDPYMIPTLFPAAIIFSKEYKQNSIFQQNFHMWKVVDLITDLKYKHQGTFPLWGIVKLNFMDRYGKLNIFSENSSRYQLFSQNSQKLSLWCKKNYPPRWICMTHIWSPTLFPGAMYASPLG